MESPRAERESVLVARCAGLEKMRVRPISSVDDLFDEELYDEKCILGDKEVRLLRGLTLFLPRPPVGGRPAPRPRDSRQ
eukprot:scaffold3519_cov59-Phaeocystis_antarctica.AAC.3